MIHVLCIFILRVLRPLQLVDVQRPDGTLGDHEALQAGKVVAELGDLAPELDGIAGEVEPLQRVVPVLRLVIAELYVLVLVQRQVELFEVAQQPHQVLHRRPGDPRAVKHEVAQRVILAVFDLWKQISGVKVGFKLGRSRNSFRIVITVVDPNDNEPSMQIMLWKSTF